MIVQPRTERSLLRDPSGKRSIVMSVFVSKPMCLSLRERTSETNWTARSNFDDFFPYSSYSRGSSSAW